MIRFPTEIEFEVPAGNLLGVMGGKEIPPVELSAEFSHGWADPIGIDAATLRAAQQSPEKYRDLIVRVAGYSDYFCNLSKALQDEIIARTDHDSF